MIINPLSFFGKRSQKYDRYELEKHVFCDIPREIFVPKPKRVVAFIEPPQQPKRVAFADLTKQPHQHEKSRLKRSRRPLKISTELGPKRLAMIKESDGLPSSTTPTSPSTTTSSNTKPQDDDTDIEWQDRLSKDTGGTGDIRKDLWKSTSDSNGQIKLVDNLCRDKVVHMMSRNDAARKKLLDDMLNHGEF